MRAGVAGLQAVLGQRGMSAGVLKKAGSPPVNVAQPLIDDSIPGVGETIYSTNGTWTGATSFTYQWFQNSLLPISGATNSSYTLQSSDIGFAVYCQVTASNTFGSTSTNSGAVDAVTATPVCQLKLYDFNLTGGLGSLVASWLDKSGNGNDEMQAVMARQPVTVAGPNGRTAVQQDGVSTFLESNLLITRPFSIISVNTGFSADSINLLNTDPTRPLIYRDDGGSTENAYGGNILTGLAWPANTFKLISGTFDTSTTANAWLNGIASIINGNDGGAAKLDKVGLGSYQRSGLSQFYQTNISSLVLYSGVVSDAVRENNEAFQLATYGPL